MNLHEYILARELADTDPDVIAIGYIRLVLGLADEDEQVAALEPSVRPHASRLASSIRRAQRAGPGQSRYDGQGHNAGPGQTRYDSQGENAGPGHKVNDGHRNYAGPGVPEWAVENAPLIAYCRDHQSDNFWIPGAGRRKLAEITGPEWDSRARWLTQQSQGAAKAAARVREYAALIEAAGVACIADVLEAVA